MLDRIFGFGRKKVTPADAPAIAFGRYSDNNKSVLKGNRWTDAETLFREKKYTESLDAFFDYLRDEHADNVQYKRNGTSANFQFYQGSKVVRGSSDGTEIRAEVTLARMPQPLVPVMRRLLEMNFNLYYSRFALENDRLCMRFDTGLESASPNKLYYGLKELATKGDKQDDLLVQDFTSLTSIDTEHIQPLGDKEKDVKYAYLQKWITDALQLANTLDAEKFSGGIAYMLLTLIYRIDYMIAPEGKLLNELEKITLIYFRKDERPVPEKNRDIIVELQKLKSLGKEELFPHLFRSKYTFSIVAPQPFKTISDSIHAANQNMIWYRDNGHPYIATQISEYGIMFPQYSYSLPQVISQFIHLYLMVNYPEFFRELGYPSALYEPAKNRFDSHEIINRIKEIQTTWKEKYPFLEFNTQNLRFDSLVSFDLSFTNEIEFLNMDTVPLPGTIKN